MTAKPTVYVLDPYHEDAIAQLESTDWIDVVLPDDARRATWHKDATAVIVRSETRVAAEDFDKAPKLRVVVKQGTGIDNIDLVAARAANVAVYNTPGLNSEAVA